MLQNRPPGFLAPSCMLTYGALEVQDRLSRNAAQKWQELDVEWCRNLLLLRRRGGRIGNLFCGDQAKIVWQDAWHMVEKSLFTLLEVLVTLVVLAVGASITLSVITGSLGNIRKVQLRTRGVEYAQSAM